METWLLLTAYRKSPALYPIVPSPTLYDKPFSHNTARLSYRIGHPRPMIFMSFESQYATSYK